MHKKATCNGQASLVHYHFHFTSSEKRNFYQDLHKREMYIRF